MDASIRSRSAILAVLLHAAIILILLFTLMTTTIPPFPETSGGGGVLVNIGMVDESSGDIQPMAENINKDPVPEKVKSTVAEEEPVATQETEAAPIASETKVVKHKVTPVKTEVKPEIKPVVEPVRKANPNALYTGKPNNSKSQGTGTGTGDQGKPNGDPKYNGKGGTGTEGGEGNSFGPGGPGPGGPGGGGVTFSLTGRHMLRPPQSSSQFQETGKVVVDITVDKEGNVVSAVPGGRGSTTTSSNLYRLAKEAAMKAKFDNSTSDADIQKGTFTFDFRLQ
jgi:hypothetical protein